MPLRLRPASTADAPALAPLLDQLGYPSTAAQVEARLAAVLAHPEYAAWVAEAEGGVVGLAGACTALYFERDGCYGRLLVLVVAEEARGTGAGRALVEEAERWMRARGATVAMVNSGTHRLEAHAFYRRLGYAETGRRLVKPLV